MAAELLKLYAQRHSVAGTPFSPDTNMQREFGGRASTSSETDDQLSAITDIKRDMESPQPMDRLLCGDVGYGKTEVAMRAAFKAVQDSKQVAVLTPTTVLSFQHYESFKRRFANFPVNIEMISRFRTPKEQKEILEKVEPTARWISSSARTASSPRTSSFRTSVCSSSTKNSASACATKSASSRCAPPSVTCSAMSATPDPADAYICR